MQRAIDAAMRAAGAKMPLRSSTAVVVRYFRVRLITAACFSRARAAADGRRGGGVSMMMLRAALRRFRWLLLRYLLFDAIIHFDISFSPPAP